MKTVRVAVAVVGAVLLVGCGGEDEPEAVATVTVPPAVDLAAASGACVDPVQDWLTEKSLTSETLPAEVVMQVGDEGRTVSISNPSGEISYLERATVIAMTCMLEQTGAPDSVVGEVSQTTAMSGRQEAEWNNVQLSYGYAGGTGVSAVFTTQ